MNTARSGMGMAQILRIVLLLVFLVVAGWLVYTIRGTLLPFGIAFVLSYVLMPLVDRMESRGLNRMVGVLVIYASTVAVFVFLFITFVPVLVAGLSDMKDRIMGEMVVMPCVVVNRGDEPILFDRFQIDSPDSDFTLVSPALPLELPPGKQDTLMVQFKPSSKSLQTARLNLYGRIGQTEVGPICLHLTGNGPAAAADISLEPIHTVAIGPATVALSDTACHFGPVESGYLNHLEMQLAELQPQLESVLPMIEGINLAEYINQRVQMFAADLLRKTPALAGTLLSGITFVVIVPFVIFFFLSEGRAIKRTFIELVPNPYFEMILNLLYRIDIQLGGYIRGLVMSVIIISLLSITGLWFIGLRDYLVVGTIAGLSNVIPYLGPIIGIVAGVVAALLQYSTLSMSVILPVVLVFLVVQIMDNVFVAPVVVARSVNLHPLVVIFVVLVGNQLFGAVGMLLAVPFTAVMKVSVQTIYEGLRSYSIT